MGINLAKYATGDQTNMSKELNINTDLISSCQLMQLQNYQYVYTDLNIDRIINTINEMNTCKYLQTNYVYITRNRIRLQLKDGNEIILALSDCNKYIGVPTRASGMGLWFHLLTDE